MLQETQEQGSFFQFQLEGNFVGFLGKPGKIKYLRLAVGDREVEIKLAKNLRNSLVEDLKVGDGIQVWGEKELKGSLRELKLKAYGVNMISCVYQPKSTCNSAQSCQKKGKILLCQKSGCVKRGGKKMYDALQEGLCNLGLQDSVTIEVTSCQKRCKHAPNMVFLPAKAKYSQIPPAEISSLLTKHYAE